MVQEKTVRGMGPESLLRGEFWLRIAGDWIGNGMLRAWLREPACAGTRQTGTHISLGMTETEWVDTDQGGSQRGKHEALSIGFVE